MPPLLDIVRAKMPGATSAPAPSRLEPVREKMPGALCSDPGLLLATDSGAGDFGGVAELARAAGRLGADMLAISPVHALFGAEPRHYSP